MLETILNSIIISIYTSYFYTLCTIVDYYRNKEDYMNHKEWNKTLSKIIPNVFIYFPCSLFILFIICPPSANRYTDYWYIELRNIFINLIFGEVYFYSIHRLFHHRLFYKYHKDHHYFKNTLGIHALYAHPVDAIVVNFGSFYILHLWFCFSIFQILFLASLVVTNTVLGSHTSGKKDFHQIHHLVWNKNYGFSVILDKVMGTMYIE